MPASGDGQGASFVTKEWNSWAEDFQNLKLHASRQPQDLKPGSGGLGPGELPLTLQARGI